MSDSSIASNFMNPEPPPRRVSLRDLAKILGVSHVTISLAMRGSPQISAAMTEKVKTVAKEHGYQPDPMLSALSNYRKNKASPVFKAVVGWINAWPEPDKLRSYQQFDAYWQGAAGAAQKLGYHLEEFTIGSVMSPKRLHQILTSRGIRSILLPPHPVSPRWDDFPWDKYYVVKFGRSLQEPRTHLVTADQALNTVLAFEKMQALGYRRIGFITEEPYMRVHGHMFEAGFLVAQRSVEPERQLPILSLVGKTELQAVAALKKWLKQHRPDVIYTDAQGIRNLIRKAGLRVPDDIAVAATTLVDTGIDSGIDQHPEEIGRVGMLLLNSIINDMAIGTPSIFRQILVEGSWVEGTSVPPR